MNEMGLIDKLVMSTVDNVEKNLRRLNKVVELIQNSQEECSVMAFCAGCRNAKKIASMMVELGEAWETLDNAQNWLNHDCADLSIAEHMRIVLDYSEYSSLGAEEREEFRKHILAEIEKILLEFE